jgi:hypothetical protein
MFIAKATIHAARARPTGPEIDLDLTPNRNVRRCRRHAFATPVKNLAEQQ